MANAFSLEFSIVDLPATHSHMPMHADNTLKYPLSEIFWVGIEQIEWVRNSPLTVNGFYI